MDQLLDISDDGTKANATTDNSRLATSTDGGSEMISANASSIVSGNDSSGGSTANASDESEILYNTDEEGEDPSTQIIDAPEILNVVSSISECDTTQTNTTSSALLMTATETRNVHNWAYFDKPPKSQPKQSKFKEKKSSPQHQNWRYLEKTNTAEDDDAIGLFPNPVLEAVCAELQDTGTFESMDSFLKTESTDSIETKQEASATEIMSQITNGLSGYVVTTTPNKIQGQGAEECDSIVIPGGGSNYAPILPSGRTESMQSTKLAVECVALSSDGSEEADSCDMESSELTLETFDLPDKSQSSTSETGETTGGTESDEYTTETSMDEPRAKRILWSGVITSNPLSRKRLPSQIQMISSSPRQPSKCLTMGIESRLQGDVPNVSSHFQIAFPASESQDTKVSSSVSQTVRHVRSEKRGGNTNSCQDPDPLMKNLLSTLNGVGSCTAILDSKGLQENEEEVIQTEIESESTDSRESHDITTVQFHKQAGPKSEKASIKEIYIAKSTASARTSFWGMSENAPRWVESVWNGKKRINSIFNDNADGGDEVKSLPPGVLPYRKLTKSKQKSSTLKTERIGHFLMILMVLFLFCLFIALFLEKRPGSSYLRKPYPPPMTRRNEPVVPTAVPSDLGPDLF